MKTWLKIFLIILILILASLCLLNCNDDDADSSKNDDSDDDSVNPDDDDDVDDDDDDDDTDDDTDDDDDDTVLEEGKWIWIPVKDTLCRDGTETGFGIRLSSKSDKLAIYLEATGVCVFEDTCNDGVDHFDKNDLDFIKFTYLKRGLLNPDEARNPLQDWSQVFLPGCTGDMHAGSRPNGFAIGSLKLQQFVGFMNLQKIFPKIEEIMEDQLSRILLWGNCSGGNATFPAYSVLAETFPHVPITLLNDSGPLGALDTAFAPCLQQTLRVHFRMSPSIPPDCTDCTLPNGDGLSNMQTYLANAYPQGNFGLLSSLEDEAIRLVWGFGQDNCTRYFTAETEEDLLLPPEIFTEALYDLRDNYLLPTQRWSTIYHEGDFHTFGLLDNWLWQGEASDYLIDWISELIQGEVPDSLEY